jgi:hypothetical protein
MKTQTLFKTILFILLSVSLHAQQKKKNVSKKTTNKTVVQKQDVKTETKTSKKSGFDLKKLQVGANIQGEFSSNSGSNSSTDFGVSVMAGYKFTDKILGGIKVGKTFRTYVSNFEVGIFGRYYYDNFFGGAGINHSSFTSSLYYDYAYYSDTYKTRYSMTYASLEGGYRIPITDKITMETSANFNIPFSPDGATSWFGVKAGAVYNF